jgi:hypothetical protein
MTKHSALLIVLGLAVYSGHSGYISAQEVNYADANMGFGPVGMTQDMAQNSPFLAPGAAPAHNHSPHYPGNNFPPRHSSGYPGGAPLVVLPVPLPANGMSGLNSGSGFPGSYMPQGTPLHRFNGYIVCDPLTWLRRQQQGQLRSAWSRSRQHGPFLRPAIRNHALSTL